VKKKAVKRRPRKLPQGAPIKHHIDKRAAVVAAQEGDDEDLLTTREVSDWLGCSPQWLEIGRSKGYGPTFQMLGPRMVRYTRANVRRWLGQRSHLRTSEYSKAAQQ
jgi:predicted DNA-binding transcriptional regulator AlpA